MLKWLAALLPRCESFAFSLLSRPNKSVQKAQLRDCTRNEERGKERVPASTASCCCCLYENWLMTLEPGLKEFVGLVLPSRLKSPPNKWYLQLRNWLRQRLQTRQEIHARFSRKLINIKVNLHNYKELFINIYMHLFYVSSCCQVIVALSSISLSRAELSRERGVQRCVCVQGRHKLPCGAKLSKSQSSIPDGRMDMNGYRWMCVNNLHYSHV